MPRTAAEQWILVSQANFQTYLLSREACAELGILKAQICLVPKTQGIEFIYSQIKNPITYFPIIVEEFNHVSFVVDLEDSFAKYRIGFILLDIEDKGRMKQQIKRNIQKEVDKVADEYVRIHEKAEKSLRNYVKFKGRDFDEVYPNFDITDLFKRFEDYRRRFHDKFENGSLVFAVSPDEAKDAVSLERLEHILEKNYQSVDGFVNRNFPGSLIINKVQRGKVGDAPVPIFQTVPLMEAESSSLMPRIKKVAEAFPEFGQPYREREYYVSLFAGLC